MRFIDCHAHLAYWYKRETTRDEYVYFIKQAKEKNVDYIVDTISYPADYNHYESQKDFKEILRSVGLGRGIPKEFGDTAPQLAKLRWELENRPPNIIGEIGLDYHWEKNDGMQRKQQKLFADQIEMAHEFNLPIAIHSRDADNDLVRILREKKADELKIQIHFCTCKKETRKKLLEMGCYLSFGGPHTYANELMEMVKETPVERILTETDAPALPVIRQKRKKGPRSYPSDVSVVATKIAEIKEIELDDFANIVMNNAKFIFGF